MNQIFGSPGFGVYAPFAIANTRAPILSCGMMPIAITAFRMITSGTWIAARIRQPDAGPPTLYGYDGALSQLQLMLGNGARTDGRLLAIANIDKPDDSGMRGTECDRKPAEILVECYQYLFESRCMSEDFVIPWIGRPVPDPLHLVASFIEFRLAAGPDTTVEQELQAASLVIDGSTRSWPTTRRA